MTLFLTVKKVDGRAKQITSSFALIAGKPHRGVQSRTKRIESMASRLKEEAVSHPRGTPGWQDLANEVIWRNKCGRIGKTNVIFADATTQVAICDERCESKFGLVALWADADP